MDVVGNISHNTKPPSNGVSESVVATSGMITLFQVVYFFVPKGSKVNFWFASVVPVESNILQFAFTTFELVVNVDFVLQSYCQKL